MLDSTHRGHEPPGPAGSPGLHGQNAQREQRGQHRQNAAHGPQEAAASSRAVRTTRSSEARASRGTSLGVTGAGSSEEDVTPGFRLQRDDAVAWLRTLEDESIDLIVTDPAYESLEKHRKIGTTTRLKHSKSSSNDWFSIFPNSRFPEFLVEAYRVLKRHRHFYLFCDQETMFVVKPIAEEVGFKFWKPLVWDKCKIGMGYHYRARYEFILFFEKGKRKLNNLSTPDILSAPRIHKGYPAEKPTSISKTLIEQSTGLGELVIDPFMGSGSVGVASVTSGRDFMGTDICQEAVDITRGRLIEAGAKEAEAESGKFAGLIRDPLLRLSSS